MANSAITFVVKDNQLRLRYEPRDGAKWVYSKFKEGEDLHLKGTFTLGRELLVDPAWANDAKSDGNKSNVDLGDDHPVLEFVVASTFDNAYFKFDEKVLDIGIPVFLARTSRPNWKWFVAEERTSVMKVIAELRPTRIVIGGNEPDAIPVEIYEGLIAQFPTQHERAKYVRARISGVVRQYTDAEVDAVADLAAYVDRRTVRNPRDLLGAVRQQEINKFESLLDHLDNMLKAQTYSEKDWETEILQIIRLLYPKYIAAFPRVPVLDSESSTKSYKQLDFMLVDVSGYVDVLEIKRPTDNCIVTPGVYRDNHVPYRELSGTVQQIEKYLYHLTRWGPNGEKILTERFASELPQELKLRIAKPSGLAILGRDNNLSPRQRHDFEIIRRQYKHIADIITYDDLLRRMRFMLEQLRAGR